MNIFQTFDFNIESGNLNAIYDAQMSRRANGKVVVTGIWRMKYVHHLYMLLYISNNMIEKKETTNEY